MNSLAKLALRSKLANGLCLLGLLLFCVLGWSETPPLRNVSGVVTTDKKEAVSGVTVEAEWASGKTQAATDADGRFHLAAPGQGLGGRWPAEPLRIRRPLRRRAGSTRTVGTYYKRELANGDILKVDGFLGRSLFDLYSNFTFFLNDSINGDEIQQHDSRLQEGVDVQYLHPYELLGHSALLTLGSNLHDNQINVGLLHTKERQVLDLTTSAHAHVTNAAGYVQQGVDLLGGRLHFDAGLRCDYFRFDVDDHVDPTHSGIQSASRFQPKANFSYTPSASIPVTL